MHLKVSYGQGDDNYMMQNINHIIPTRLHNSERHKAHLGTKASRGPGVRHNPGCTPEPTNLPSQVYINFIKNCKVGHAICSCISPNIIHKYLSNTCISTNMIQNSNPCNQKIKSPSI